MNGLYWYTRGRDEKPDEGLSWKVRRSVEWLKDILYKLVTPFPIFEEGLKRQRGEVSASPSEDAAPEGLRWQDWVLVFTLLLGILYIFTISNRFVITAVLYSSIAFIFLGLRRPAYIIAGIIIVEFTIVTFEWGFLGPIATSRYGPILAGTAIALVTAPLYIKDARHRLGPGAAWVLVPGAMFVALAVVSTSAGVRPGAAIEAGRFFGAGFIFMTMIPLLIRDRYDLKVVGKVAIVVIVFSGIAAAFQGLSFAPDFATELDFDADERDGRVIGLTRSPIQAANVLVIGFLICLAMTTSLKTDNFWGVAFLLFTLIVAVGFFHTGTRSGLFGIGVGIPIIIFLLKGRVRKEMLLIVAIVGGVFAASILGSNSRYTQTTSDDRSAASRVVLWKVGIAIALDNMELGTGYGSFIRIAPLYLDQVDVSEQDRRFDTSETVELVPVHNDFIRVWHEFGVGGLVLYCLLIGFACLNLLKAYFRTEDPWLRGMSLGLLAALIGYTVNATFHNYLNVSYALWGMAGFSAALLKVTTHEREEA